MFCNFCGKNFDPSEGFEEVSRSGHHYVRCEKCVYEQQEVEYDWHATMYGLFANTGFNKRSVTAAQGVGGGRFQKSQTGRLSRQEKRPE